MPSLHLLNQLLIVNDSTPQKMDEDTITIRVWRRVSQSIVTSSNDYDYCIGRARVKLDKKALRSPSVMSYFVTIRYR